MAEWGVDDMGGLRAKCITSQDREHRGRPACSGGGGREVGEPLGKRIHVHLDFRVIKILLAIAVIGISISPQVNGANVPLDP